MTEHSKTIVEENRVWHAPEMNFRRGFLRLWIVATGIWIAGWAWHYADTCRDYPGQVFIAGFLCSPSYILEDLGPADEPSARRGPVTIRPVPPDLKIGAIQMGITLIGVPLGILAMSWLTVWVIRGFRSN
jgi:hypothetical protein